jgi:hypothetical protein
VSLLHAGQIKDNEHVATISKNFLKKIQYHLKSSKAKDINQKKKKTMSSYIRKGPSKYASITAKQEKSI